MHKLMILIFVVAGFAATSPAQGYITSPKGYMSTEGNALFYLTSGVNVNRRYMGIDNTNLNTVRSFKNFALRRDAGTPNSTAGATTITTSLHMGTGNFTRLFNVCDRNYVGPKVSVFKRRMVNFPNWTQVVSTPGPWDFSLTFDQQFLYLGTGALIWDLTISGATSGNRTTDRQYSGYDLRTATTLGAGCVATGQTYGFIHQNALANNGPTMPSNGMRLRINAARAPANASVLMSLALTDSNLTIPGWCAKLHAVPLLLLPLGSRSDGFFHTQVWNFPYTAGVVGQTFVTQCFAPDPGAPNGLVLSNGTTGTMPASTATGTAVEAL